MALRRTTTVSAAELHSIKPYRGGGGLYVIHHERGKIRLLAQVTGLHEVISSIKTANPNFEVDRNLGPDGPARSGRQTDAAL